MSSKSIVVLVSGNGSNLQAIIDACELPADHAAAINGTVKAVISNRPGVYGLERAANHQIDAITLDHKLAESREAYDQALMAKIDEYQPDLVILAGFMRILTPAFVQHFQGKMLNIHPSLLPKYQGLHTHQRAIDAGDTEHGVSVHFVTEELDGGPVILQATVPVFEDDTADILAQRVHEQEHRIYPLVAKWFCSDRLKMVEHEAWLDNEKLAVDGYAND